ncbi:group II intron reverse transcriptase/maturase [Ammoniphilus resinae]|uniref:Group II intron reverse transcriptase/maturase n=1 Tax=Ammoniphilus resinae TaxID=861532 RepID=A0ABS4GP44_9BACL|nr:group II intron reverse transcriptase/maturase [Ammoniphilus resinae]
MDAKKARQRVYYNFSQTQNGLYQSSKNGKKNFKNLMELILMDENILLAYRSIKSNSGSKTRGSDDETIVNLAETDQVDFISKMKSMVSDYHPKEVRRVWIPKPNGEKRPLGIPSITDRIIQQMFLNILEPICEGKFYEHSYGFRPLRSTHHAISRVQTLMNKKWHYTVDIDIKGFFDNVNHNLLLKQLWNIGIKDKRVIAVIGKMLKATIKGEGIPSKGVPQGGILSPLLSNIVLNDLDQWVAGQYSDFPTKNAYSCKDARIRAIKTTNLKEGFIVRYADDFKIMAKDYDTATRWFYAVQDFLKHRLKLDISQEKSKVKNLRKKHTDFLGYKLKVYIKGKKLVARTSMADKKVDQIAKSLRDRIIAIQKNPIRENVTRYNAFVLGIQNYFRFTTSASVVFRDLQYKIRGTLRFRLRKRGKYGYPTGLTENSLYTKHYTTNVKTYTIDKIPMFPVSQVKTVNIRNFSQDKNPYETELFAWDTEIYKLMISRLPNRSVEYMDNRLSRYSMQKGKCAITGIFLSAENVHCHHKVPVHLGGTDKFSNLIIIHKEIHTLIHAS